MGELVEDYVEEDRRGKVWFILNVVLSVSLKLEVCWYVFYIRKCFCVFFFIKEINVLWNLLE